MLTAEWQAYIKREIQKDINGSDEMRGNLFHAVSSWDSYWFANRDEAQRVSNEFITACQIRTYCRRHSITTRKGSHHAFNANYEHLELWTIIRRGGMDGSADGVRWSWRQVDEIKNIYLSF